MNIAYVHSVSKIGGAEKVTLDMIKALSGSSHQLYLAIPEEGPLSHAALDIGATPEIFSISQPDLKRPIATVLNHLKWIQFLRKKKISLIHTGDLFVTRTLIFSANLLSIPIVCHVHFPIENPALNWIFKRYPACTYFIYCSHELHQSTSVKIKNILPNSYHHVLHNGVDTHLYAKFKPTKRVLTQDHINIGIIANLQERKGHFDFIETANILCQHHDNLRFHIIGGDIFGEAREPLLRARVEKLGLDKYIKFHGQVSNVRDYLNELDIFVCSSHEEAFPISILEAMSFELPIVSTNVNGIPEALTDGETGLLSPPKEPRLQALAIEKLINNPIFRTTLAQNARAEVERKFSLEIFSAKISALYKSIHSARTS